jgi:hypothetical protein
MASGDHQKHPCSICQSEPEPDPGSDLNFSLIIRAEPRRELSPSRGNYFHQDPVTWLVSDVPAGRRE